MCLEVLSAYHCASDVSRPGYGLICIQVMQCLFVFGAETEFEVRFESLGIAGAN